MGATSSCTPKEIALTPEGKEVSLATSIGFLGDVEQIYRAKARDKTGEMGGFASLPGSRECKVYRCP